MYCRRLTTLDLERATSVATLLLLLEVVDDMRGPTSERSAIGATSVVTLIRDRDGWSDCGQCVLVITWYRNG